MTRTLLVAFATALLFGVAAAPALGAGRWEASRQFSDGHGRRLTFARYTPAGAQRSGVPLVVMLHGCTQNPDDFAAGTAMNEAASADPPGFDGAAFARITSTCQAISRASNACTRVRARSRPVWPTARATTPAQSLMS